MINASISQTVDDLISQLDVDPNQQQEIQRMIQGSDASAGQRLVDVPQATSVQSLQRNTESFEVNGIKKYGYDGYGVDISEPSIKNCQKKINKKKFKHIDFEVNQNDNYFNKKFDLIISIQVLYYLNDIDLKNRLISLNKMLKPGGYVFFTMMGTKNEYYKYFCDKRNSNDGLYKVNLSSDKNYKKRQKQSIYYHYINFTKNEKDLKNKFRLFKPLKIGYYDGSLTSTKKSGHHYTFFGKKK